MDLYEKIRTLPTQPGVYLYKNAEGEVIYVGMRGTGDGGGTLAGHVLSAHLTPPASGAITWTDLTNNTVSNAVIQAQ